MSTTVRAVCAECEQGFADPSVRQPCPQCGATRRDIFLGLQEQVSAEEWFSPRQRRPGWPGQVRRLVSRYKRSRSGLEAREVLDIDRSDMQKTVKRHHVEELQNGEWKVVHDEETEFPAKRRPQ